MLSWFWTSPTIPQLLWVTYFRVWSHSQQKGGILVLSFRWAPLRWVKLSNFQSPYPYTGTKFPPSLRFSTLNNPSLLSLSPYDRCFSPSETFAAGDYLSMSMCCDFGNKGPHSHSAALPSTGVGRRMERRRQKLVGWDKGSLTEQGTLLTCGQLVHRTPDPFLQSCFRGRFPQPLLVHGVITPQVQHFTIPYVEHSEFPVRSFLQLV